MAVPYTNLYQTTNSIISKFKPSLSAYFAVHINGNFGGVRSDDIDFLAHDAVLPGTTFQTTDVYGDRQGITETFATKRSYSQVTISFYVDYDYKVLNYFHSWAEAISVNPKPTVLRSRLK